MSPMGMKRRLGESQSMGFLNEDHGEDGRLGGEADGRSKDI